MYKKNSGSQVLSSYHVPGRVQGTVLCPLPLGPPCRSSQLVLSLSSPDSEETGSEAGTHSNRRCPRPL